MDLGGVGPTGGPGTVAGAYPSGRGASRELPPRPVGYRGSGDGGSVDPRSHPVSSDRTAGPTGAAPRRGVLALTGTAAAGFAMGVAEVMPGFSGGTVALVSGIYERLIANIRRGARSLSLLSRGRLREGLEAFRAIDWAFVTVLAAGMALALVTTVSGLRLLLDERPQQMQAVFLGLVLGAAVVAGRQLRAPQARHVPIALAAAVASFVLLGFSPGMLEDPGLALFLLGGMVAVMAWILPGVSGSFLLLIVGLYPAVLDAAADRDLVVLAVFAVGCVLGLAAFSTLLNWVLVRAHDVVLAGLIGLMLGSARVLWPWPVDAPLGSSEVALPQGDGLVGILALVAGAFAVVVLVGSATFALERRRAAEGVISSGSAPH